jgi:hypothetical protein
MALLRVVENATQLRDLQHADTFFGVPHNKKTIKQAFGGGGRIMRFIYLCRVAGRPGGTNLFPSRRSRSIRDRVCQSAAQAAINCSLRSLALATHTTNRTNKPSTLTGDYFLALEFARRDAARRRAADVFVNIFTDEASIRSHQYFAPLRNYSSLVFQVAVGVFCLTVFRIHCS